MKTLLLMGALISAQIFAQSQPVARFDDIAVNLIGPGNCMAVPPGDLPAWAIKMDAQRNEMVVLVRTESMNFSDHAKLMTTVKAHDARFRPMTALLDGKPEQWKMRPAKVASSLYLVMIPRDFDGAFDRLRASRKIEFKFEGVSLLTLTKDPNITEALKHTLRCATFNPPIQH